MADLQKSTTSDRQSITDKELQYVKDFLSWELLAIKKCNATANACEDSAIQGMIRQTGSMHVKHYEAILAQLQ
jgi:hypothetical protein